MADDVLAKLQAFLTEKKFKLGSLGGVQHGCGLPPHSVQVEPGYQPIDGGATIVVTPTSVQMWVCRYPWAMHDWFAYGPVTTYGSPGELEAILRKMGETPRGCW